MPNYRHHKASGQAFVQVNGKRFYLGVHGTAESQERYARFIAERAAGQAVPRSQKPAKQAQDLSVVEVTESYWQFAQGYYRKNGRPSGSLPRVKVALRHLCQLYGRQPAADFGPLALQSIQETLAQKGRARRYVNDLAKTIRRVFKWVA